MGRRVQRLTINVTGHFAFFADEIFKLNLREAFIYFLYIFLLGLFLSIFGQVLIDESPNLLAYSLLLPWDYKFIGNNYFQCSCENNAPDRIIYTLELNSQQLFFYNLKEQREKLYASIKLRLIIISFFLFGGIIGEVVYTMVQLHVLAITATILLMG